MSDEDKKVALEDVNLTLGTLIKLSGWIFAIAVCVWNIHTYVGIPPESGVTLAAHRVSKVPVDVVADISDLYELKVKYLELRVQYLEGVLKARGIAVGSLPRIQPPVFLLAGPDVELAQSWSSWSRFNEVQQVQSDFTRKQKDLEAKLRRYRIPRRLGQGQSQAKVVFSNTRTIAIPASVAPTKSTTHSHTTSGTPMAPVEYLDLQDSNDITNH